MDLIWLDSNPHPNPDEFPNEHRQTEHGVEAINESRDPESAKLRVVFNRFGRGQERRPSFAVEVNWLDVKGFIRQFIKTDHPEARHLRRLIQLADAIEGAGWHPDDPPNIEFDQILP